MEELRESQKDLNTHRIDLDRARLETRNAETRIEHLQR